MKKLSEKYPVLYMLTKHVVGSFIKTLLSVLVVLIIVVAILFFTGLYDQIASALNLKYNSPFILVPLYGSITLALLSLFIGFLLHFHKYKRARTKGRFYRAFSRIINAQAGVQVEKNW